MMPVIAAVAWTYWMALPFLVATACALLVFVCAYVKKVVEPRLLYEDELRRLELLRSGQRPGIAPRSTLRGARSPDGVSGTSAAIVSARAARRHDEGH